MEKQQIEAKNEGNLSDSGCEKFMEPINKPILTAEVGMLEPL